MVNTYYVEAMAQDISHAVDLYVFVLLVCVSLVLLLKLWFLISGSFSCQLAYLFKCNFVVCCFLLSGGDTLQRPYIKTMTIIMIIHTNNDNDTNNKQNNK